MGRGIGEADRAEDRGDVDDRAPAFRGGDGRQLCAQAVEDGVLVDLDDLPPRVKRVLPHRRGRAADARVVDGDAQRPKLAGRCDGALRELLVGDVAHRARGRAPRSVDLVHHSLRAGFVNVVGENRGTVGGEQARDGAPDPRTSTGDDRGTFPLRRMWPCIRPFDYCPAAAGSLPTIGQPQGGSIGR